MTELLLPEAAVDGIKYEKLSAKYDLISTGAVVELMREEGFRVTQANQLKPRKRDPRVVRHFVRMRHESYLKEINGSVPEILLINANDGSSSLRMEAGMFRMICSNGLIVKSHEIDSVRIRHIDVTAERVIEEANKVIGAGITFKNKKNKRKNKTRNSKKSIHKKKTKKRINSKQKKFTRRR